MTGTIRRGKITRADLANWDGKNPTYSRVDATGGTTSGLAVGNEVDVLQVYGNGTDRLRASILSAINQLGSSEVTLLFAPGTWSIDGDTTIPSNFISRVPAGCIFNVDSGKTLTFGGPVLVEGITHTAGLGTVVGIDDVGAHGAFYLRTEGERTLGVTPSNYTQPISPQRYGAAADGVTDDTTAVQTFFNVISAAQCDAHCDGAFAISAGIFIGPSGGSMATLRIAGNANFVALAAIDTMITTRNCQGLEWAGIIKLIGIGGASYASRTCRIGAKIGDSGLTSRMKCGGFFAQYFSQVGVAAKELSTVNELGNVRAYDCGSGMSAAGSSLTANWSNKVDSGSTGSTAQTSRIDVDQMPPTTVETPTLVVIGSNVHYVTATDVANSRITLFPWIDTSLSSGALIYLFGAGVYLKGSDAGIIGIPQADVQRCGAGIWQAALYGPVISRLVAQFCGAGLVVGFSPSSAAVGLQVNGFYCESNDFDLVRLTRSTIGGHIVSEYAFNFSKVAYTAAPRLTSGNTLSLSVTNELGSLIIDSLGVSHQQEKHAANATDAASTFALDVTAEPKYRRIYKRNSWTVNLSAPSTAFNNAFGYDTGQLILVGTNNDGSPTGTVTFNAPSLSTVNGGSSAAFAGFDGPAVFIIHYDFATLAFTVKPTNYTAAIPQTITYSASMTPDVSLGKEMVITATDSVAHTINAPINGRSGQRITITIRNTSGGALGTATWNAVYKMASWTQPGSANSRSITFRYNGTNYVEIVRTASDIPN
jgi:hypothetical protein